MDHAPAWVLSIIHVTVAAVAFSAGLSSAGADLAAIRRRPGLMLRALLAVLIVVPLLAVALVKIAAPGNVVGGGVLIAALAVGPVAAFRRSRKQHADVDFALVLNVALLILSVAFVPIAVALVGVAFDRELRLGAGEVARVILPLQLLPLLGGIVVGRLAPQFTARVEKSVARLTNLGLALIALLVLVAVFKPLLALGVRAWILVGSFACIAIATGHLLGGPDANTRMVVASFSGLRFPGLAIAISALAHDRDVMPVVLAYVICSVLLLSVYLAVARSLRKPAQPPLGGLPAA